MITDYAKQHIKEIVSRGEWTFAKTMKNIPHEYVVKGQTMDANDYACLHAYICRYGEIRRFGKKEYKYLFFEGRKYWYMRERLEESICINRAKA